MVQYGTRLLSIKALVLVSQFESRCEQLVILPYTKFRKISISSRFADFCANRKWSKFGFSFRATGKLTKFLRWKVTFPIGSYEKKVNRVFRTSRFSVMKYKRRYQTLLLKLLDFFRKTAFLGSFVWLFQMKPGKAAFPWWNARERKCHSSGVHFLWHWMKRWLKEYFADCGGGEFCCSLFATLTDRFWNR